MNRLLLDTHIWIWYLKGDEKLGPSIKNQIDANLENLWLSPISVWEVGVLHSKGRVQFRDSLDSWLHKARTRLPIREAVMNFEIARILPSLEFDHRDPADQFLAATTLVYDLSLVTVDRNLVRLPWLPTISS